MAKRNPLTWSFDDEGIAQQSRSDQGKLNWSAIGGFVLGKGLMCLRLSSGKTLFFPLRLLNAQQESELLQILQDKNVRRLA